jgi:GNAT superfamily N-acetyltransferase
MPNELVMGELVISDGNELRDRLQNFPWADQFLRSKILVAYINNNEIIGACGIRRRLNYLTILVKDGYHNQGIGKLLLERLINVTRIKGIDFITLITSFSNHNALHLFYKFGFKDLTWYSDGNKKYLIMFLASSAYEPNFYLLRIILSMLPKKIISETIEIMKGRF